MVGWMHLMVGWMHVMVGWMHLMFGWMHLTVGWMHLMVSDKGHIFFILNLWLLHLVVFVRSLQYDFLILAGVWTDSNYRGGEDGGGS